MVMREREKKELDICAVFTSSRLFDFHLKNREISTNWDYLIIRRVRVFKS